MCVRVDARSSTEFQFRKPMCDRTKGEVLWWVVVLLMDVSMVSVCSGFSLLEASCQSSSPLQTYRNPARDLFTVMHEFQLIINPKRIIFSIIPFLDFLLLFFLATKKEKKCEWQKSISRLNYYWIKLCTIFSWPTSLPCPLTLPEPSTEEYIENDI